MGDLDDVRQTLKQIAGLVSEMVEPVKLALIEIERARRRQIWLMWLVAALLCLNAVVLGYILVANQRLTVAIGGAHLEQTVTAVQLDKLIDLAAESASTPDVKIELEQIQAFKAVKPQAVLREVGLDAAASDAVPSAAQTGSVSAE